METSSTNTIPMKDLEALPIITVCPKQKANLKALKSIGYGVNWRDILTGKFDFYKYYELTCDLYQVYYFLWS